MARRFARAFERTEARDVERLPHEPRVLRPGPYGTFPGRTDGSYPKAPPLDDGALYTGEWREDVNGNVLTLPGDGSTVTLASLRREWPFVGFALDTSRVPPGVTVTALPRVLIRGAPSSVVLNVLAGATPPVLTSTGPATPNAWIALIGLMPGARVEIVARLTPTEASADVRAVVWGYNAPGYGP